MEINSKDYVAERDRDMKVNGVYGRSTEERRRVASDETDHHPPFLFWSPPPRGAHGDGFSRTV